MKRNQEDVKNATEKLDELCLSCEEHLDTCYVAVAKRAIATLKEPEKERAERP